MSGLKLREYLDRHAFASAPTQVTDAIRTIKPVRLTNTDPIPVVEPPTSQVVHIGSVHPTLANLTPMSQNVILSAYRMAYLHRHIGFRDASYIIQEIWAEQTGKIMARLEREDT